MVLKLFKKICPYAHIYHNTSIYQARNCGFLSPEGRSTAIDLDFVCSAYQINQLNSNNLEMIPSTN